MICEVAAVLSGITDQAREMRCGQVNYDMSKVVSRLELFLWKLSIFEGKLSFPYDFRASHEAIFSKFILQNVER